MRKNSIPAKLLPLAGLVALPAVLFVGLAQAAAPFTPPNPPVVGYVGQPEMTSYNLKTGVESIFRGEYEKGGWSGNLSCYPISAKGVVDTTVPCWTSGTGATLKTGAQSQVDLQGFVSGSRNIATLDLTGAKQAFTLAVDPANLIDANHVNFIRGDRSQEAPGGALRTRSSVLGDVIHSRPFYYTDGISPTVFYGGNDGMLHAIDATQAGGGKERWAYIPSMLIPKLKQLWSTTYNSTHENYVDGNVNMINVGTATAPQNILVGVLGSGGKGIYALDVTSLTATSDASVAAKALWEITPAGIAYGGTRTASATYANLGDTYSNPTLAKIQSGQNAVIVGNGYNNTGNGHATLLVINVATGSKIAEIDTGAGTLASPDGLSTPAAVDTNGDGMVDIAYAGDIDGNMWRFDLVTMTAKKLYAAGQPITMMPGVSAHPYGGYMVNFGTGKTLITGDLADKSVNYVYGIWDGAPAGNATLVTQTITVRQYVSAVGATPVDVRVVGTLPASTTVTPNWNPGGDIGWKAALPVAGERVTGDSAFDQYGRFFFNATNPTIQYNYTPPGGTMISGNGENWLMELDYLSGGSAIKPIFDMNADGVLNDADRIRYAAGDTIPPPSVLGDPIMTNFGIPVGFRTSYGVQSQPILGAVGNFSAMFYNQSWDVLVANTTTSTTTTSQTGIGGGHFDVDMFTAGIWGSGSIPGTHTHEYDKIYDTNGLNFLNPNETDKALRNAIDPATGKAVTATTPYKVLMMNQSWNRAVFMTLGKNIWNTKDYLTGPYKTPDPVTGLDYNPMVGGYNASYTTLWTPGATGVGALKMSSLPTYTGTTSSVVTFTQANATAPTPLYNKVTVNTVKAIGSIGCGGLLNGTPLFATAPACSTTSTTTGSRKPDAVGGVGGFEFSMPNTAFQLLDWWKDGVVQTGVMPTAPQCPDASNADGTEPANGAGQGRQYIGSLGERNDGVLTVLVVKDTTPDGCVKLNAPGRPDLGFTVSPAYSATCAKPSGGKSTPILNYVIAEYIIYWHHPYATCYGDTTSTWKTANNDGDPWWPAQESGNNPDLTGTRFGTKPDLTAALCNNNPNGASTAAWIATAPPSTWTTPAAAWTTPPGWLPKGFTITPPLDTATTLPLCPKYSTTADDPRTASFVTSSPGTSGSTTTTSTTTITALPPGFVGGAASITTPCTGASCTSCVGAACNTPPCVGAACNPQCGQIGQPACPNQPPIPVSKRISWHELIKQ